MVKAHSPKIKKPIGRPTNYRPEFCQDILAYFGAVEQAYTIDFEVSHYKDGGERRRPIRVAVEPPTLWGWCHRVGIHYQTLHEWAERNPAFGEAVNRAKTWFAHLLVTGGLMGVYESRYSQLAAVNLIGWRSASVQVSGELDVHHHRDPAERNLLNTMAREVALRIRDQEAITVPALPPPEEHD